MRRIAFFLSIRLCSLLETNQRLFRTSLKTPLRMTAFRKRRNNLSWDSPFLNFTFAKTIPPFKDYSLDTVGIKKRTWSDYQIPRSLHLSKTNDFVQPDQLSPSVILLTVYSNISRFLRTPWNILNVQIWFLTVKTIITRRLNQHFCLFKPYRGCI